MVYFREELYFKKIGLMGLSCNQCHDEVGLNLRAEKVVRDK